MERKISSPNEDGQDREKTEYWRNWLLDLEFNKNSNRKNEEDNHNPSFEIMR